VPQFVFDSSAVLAIALKESGTEYASQRLEGSLISAVNLIEVITKLIDLELQPTEIDQVMAGFMLEVVDLDQNQALVAGALRKQTRSKGLSLGDRACLALAKSTGRIALTADRAWADLDVDVKVEVIR
jgi:ribonuclease VapC